METHWRVSPLRSLPAAFSSPSPCDAAPHQTKWTQVNDWNSERSRRPHSALMSTGHESRSKLLAGRNFCATEFPMNICSGVDIERKYRCLIRSETCARIKHPTMAHTYTHEEIITEYCYDLRHCCCPGQTGNNTLPVSTTVQLLQSE